MCLQGYSMTRKEYINRRLMELACIAETRELDPIEIAEEKRLEIELETLSKEA